MLRSRLRAQSGGLRYVSASAALPLWLGLRRSPPAAAAPATPCLPSSCTCSPHGYAQLRYVALVAASRPHTTSACLSVRNGAYVNFANKINILLHAPLIRLRSGLMRRQARGYVRCMRLACRYAIIAQSAHMLCNLVVAYLMAQGYALFTPLPCNPALISVVCLGTGRAPFDPVKFGTTKLVKRAEIHAATETPLFVTDATYGISIGVSIAKVRLVLCLILICTCFVFSVFVHRLRRWAFFAP